jgi:asparagine synthetase B (glutamine-hydrolysing)
VERYAPQQLEQFAVHVQVAVFKPAHLGDYSNVSHSELPGAFIVTRLDDPLIMADRFIHELHHNRLFCLEEKGGAFFDDERLPQLLTDDFHERLGGADAAEVLLAAYRECPSRDFVTRTTCADVLTYLPCDILTKVDIASMTYALEARCPILDQEVVNLAASMPVEWKIKHGRMKRILIETFSDLLPPAIQQRGKMGFGVPLSHWFRGELQPLLKEVLLDRRSLDRGLFRPEAVEKLVQDHVTGLTDHSSRLWALLVLELWQKKFLDAARADLRLLKASA